MSKARFFYALFFVVVAAFLLAGLAGCSKEAVKPSDESVRASRALGTLQEIERAYIARDYDGVVKSVAREFRPGYAEYIGTVRQDMETYDRVELTLSVDRIEEAPDEVSVAFHWFGVWYDGEGGETQRRGNSVFVFRDSGAVPLIDVVGDALFGVVR